MKCATALLTALLAIGLAAFARAEVVQHGNFRVQLDADLTPKRLPRDRPSPVRFATAIRFIGTGRHTPPQLRMIRIEINSHGEIHSASVPSCQIDRIQPATSANALRACRNSLVGEGHLSSKVMFTQQAPFPSEGKVQAFNGRWKGRPAILAHVYGDKPIPTSYTIPFVTASIHRGTYGTTLSASVPQFSGKWGYVSSISLSLGGFSRGYLTATCPAPRGVPIVGFPLSRTLLGFAGPSDLRRVVSSTCRPR